MELMSVLLLCAFVATLPQALEASDIQVESNTPSVDKSLTPSLISRQELKVNASPIVNTDADITKRQASIMSNHCKHCFNCLEQAFGANQQLADAAYSRQPDELYYDLQEQNLKSYIRPRKQRSVRTKSNKTEKSNKLKKVKAKPTSAWIRTYANKDEEIYAIKVNEIGKSDKNTGNSTCTIYSVKNALPCKSGGNELAMLKKKKMKSKKLKSKKLKKIITTTTEAPMVAPSFKKRKFSPESPHMAESFMPSVEEFN